MGWIFVPLPSLPSLPLRFLTSADADDAGDGAPAADLEVAGEPCSDPSESGVQSVPGASSGVVSGPLPVSAPLAWPSTWTLTLTSDPVALSLYYEWSLEEVKAVLREVFRLQPRTQVRRLSFFFLYIGFIP